MTRSSRLLRFPILGSRFSVPHCFRFALPLGDVLMHLPTYADILAAAPVVHRYLKPTPLYEWPALSQLLGCRYFLKHENHTPTTAFKVRGGIYLVARLTDEQKRRGIIGCTTGNHGQSLAYACRLFGVRCVLVVPT